MVGGRLVCVIRLCHQHHPVCVCVLSDCVTNTILCVCVFLGRTHLHEKLILLKWFDETNCLMPYPWRNRIDAVSHASLSEHA